MKRAIFLSLLFFVNVLVHGESNFLRIYDFGRGYSLFQNDAGEKFVTGFSKTRNFILKFDSSAEFLWKVDLNSYNNQKTFGAEYLPTGNVISAATYNGDILVEEVNPNGEIVSSKVFDEGGDEEGYGIVQTSDKGFLIYGSNDFDSVFVIKTDSALNQLSLKTFPLRTKYSSVKTRIVRFPNNRFVLYSSEDFELIIIDEEGNLVKQITLSSKVESVDAFPNGDLFVALANNKIERISSTGTVLIDRSVEHRPRAIKLASDGGFLLGYYEGYASFDSSYNKVWEVNEIKSFLPVQIVENSDGGFQIMGINPWKKYLVMIKTDGNGKYHVIRILEPNGGIYPCFSILRIKFETDEDISRIDVNYSTDSGNNWIQLAQNYDASIGYYDWIIPHLNSHHCRIKISATGNPGIFDKGYRDFEVYPYQDYDTIAVNNCKMWVSSNGDGSFDPNVYRAGFYWPKDSSTTAVFEDGLVFGGKVDGEIRVGGSTYKHGLQAGAILPDGTAPNPKDSTYKIYKMRKDWESLPDGIFKERLRYDYENWPMEIGAPFEDVNGNGKYDAGIDKPALIGDETLFFVSNDLDSSLTKNLYGSPPIGLEIQTTVWAYDSSNFLVDVIFKKYKVINKSGKEIKDMYFSYWYDDDLGDANDDYAGFDTTLSLGYTYNGTNNDPKYGSPPPAVAHMFLQGPITPATEQDSAFFNGKWIHGFRNIPMTSSFIYFGASPVFCTPYLGAYEGTIAFYNNMQGLTCNGSPFTDPTTGQTVKCILTGDPVTRTGWYEGEGWPSGPDPGDRKAEITSGPFDLAPGDTQEVVIAIFVAKGTDNIQSVAELRKKAVAIQEFYFGHKITAVKSAAETPKNYYLSYNYPNPFNPSTRFTYQLPKKELVTIKVFDVLGREVRTLVNEVKPAGKYKLNFNAANLASGVYLVVMKAGNFVQTRKILLTK